MKGVIWTCLILILISCGAEKSNTPVPTGPKSISGIEEVDEITRLIFKDKTDPKLYAQRAQANAKHGIFENAIYDYKKAIELDSVNTSYFHKLSDAYMDNLQSKEALMIMEGTVVRFPNQIPSMLKLSETQFILKQYESSMLTASKVLSINPQEPEGYFMLGMNFRSSGDTIKAINSFQTAIELNPELIDAWLIIADMYEAQQNPLAKDYYDGAVSADGNNISALHSKAYYLQNHNKVDEALKIYDEIILKDKFYPDSYLNSGVLYLERDSIARAHGQFLLMTKVAPQNYLGHFYLGMANELMGDFDQARENFRSAKNLNGSDKRIDTAIIRVSEKQGN